MTPIVSVVIPTYERQRLTDRAIDSVTTRCPEAVEIVIVDDAGLEPFRCVASANKAGVATRVIRLEVNGGPGVARFKGVQAAKGELVAFLDSDDEFVDGWIDALLECQSDYGGERPLQAMIVGQVQNSQFAAGLAALLLKSLPTNLRLTVARMMSVFFNPFYTPSIAITRSSLRFHPDLRYCEDYFMVTVSSFQVDCLLLPDVIACRLGRQPNTKGGASSQLELMRRGEALARQAVAQEPSVPIWHRALYPLGLAYQALRTATKALLK